MFHDNLKHLRISHDYTMDQLCDLYNQKYDGRLNKSTLSRYENGLQEPMFTVVKNLADFFQISIDEMIYGNIDDKFPKLVEFDPHKNKLLELFDKLTPHGKEKAVQQLTAIWQDEIIYRNMYGGQGRAIAYGGKEIITPPETPEQTAKIDEALKKNN